MYPKFSHPRDPDTFPAHCSASHVYGVRSTECTSVDKPPQPTSWVALLPVALGFPTLLIIVSKRGGHGLSPSNTLWYDPPPLGCSSRFTRHPSCVIGDDDEWRGGKPRVYATPDESRPQK